MLAPEQRCPKSGKPAPVVQSAAETSKQGRPAAHVVRLHADAGARAAPPAPLLPLNKPTAATSIPPAAELVAEPGCPGAGRPAAQGAPAAVQEAAASPAPADSGSAECKAVPRAVATRCPAAFPVAGSVEGSDASGASLSSSSSGASGAEAKPAQRTRDLWGGAAADPQPNSPVCMQVSINICQTWGCEVVCALATKARGDPQVSICAAEAGPTLLAAFPACVPGNACSNR